MEDRQDIESPEGKKSRPSPKGNKSPSMQGSKSLQSAFDLPQGEHGAHRLGNFENREYTNEEHHEWALNLWRRMDRDHSGSITREELNCEEFQDMLHSVIAPDNTSPGAHATYGRSEMHIQQALDFCLRKASLNSDGTLSFAEWEAFTKMLRNQGDEHNRVHLIFAMFDLDGNNRIDKEEFVGIFAFFVGHQPCMFEVETAFEQMDKYDKKEVTRNQFIRWLKTDAPLNFKHHAAGVHVDPEEEEEAKKKAAKVKPRVKKIHRPAPGLLPRSDSVPTWTNSWHSLWNDRFVGKDPFIHNKCPVRMRHFFSAPSTLPELDRFYNTYSGFEKHKRRLHRPPSPINRPILSTQSRTKEVNPERAAPGGTAKSSKGDRILWDNEWPDKASDFSQKVNPASLLLRCPGKPPPMLLLGRDADHIAYRARLSQTFSSSFPSLMDGLR